MDARPLRPITHWHIGVTHWGQALNCEFSPIKSLIIIDFTSEIQNSRPDPKTFARPDPKTFEIRSEK